MEKLTESELLNFAIENGMIDFNTIQKQIEMNERKKYLEMHKNEIWQGKDNGYYTYLPDETQKKGRKLVRKSTIKKLEDAIVEFYKTDNEAPTINKIFNQWINEKLEFGEICKATYDKYEGEFKRFFIGSILDKKSIRYITEDVLEMFIRKTIVDFNLTVKGYSGLRTLILGIFKYAKRKKLTTLSISTFFKDLDLSKKAFRRNCKAKESQVFSEDEIPIIIEWLKNHPSIENYGIILCFQTGIRVGELSGLKYSDITGKVLHVQRQEIRYRDESTNKITHKIADYTKTEAGDRSVILTDNALNTIRQIRKLNPFGEYLMQDGNRKFWKNTFNDRIYKACDKCGLPRRSMHKIRKTYGTTLIDANVDDSLIMSQMGHSDISTTRKYYYYSNKNSLHNQEQIEKAISF